MNRRDFLRASAALSGVHCLSFPAWASAPRRSLVMIELKGGNDDLYSFPLIDDPVCARLRPTLNVPASDILALSSQRGFHPTLAPLKTCWDAGEVALVQGLMAGPTELSHFAAGQRWETGTVDRPSERTGWLAHAWKQGSVPSVPGDFDAVVFGFNPAILNGGGLRLLELSDTEVPGMQPASQMEAPVAGNPTLAHLQRVYHDWSTSRRMFAGLARHETKATPSFTGHPIGQALLRTAVLLQSDSPPAICKLVLGSFDTHIGQHDRQQKLWGPLVHNLLAFRSVMRRSGLWNRTTVATYSEFGRRVAESSTGTDHGGASTQMVLGGAVRGGWYGERPRLNDLDKTGNVRSTLDFRSYYNTLWLEALGQPRPAFDTAAFPSLALLRA